MLRVVLLGVAQSIILVSAQVALKLALARMEPFQWSAAFWTSLLRNWVFALAGLLFGAASLLWIYIVKHFPFSTAYPLVSLSYVFGMVAAMLIFHEQVGWHKWIGAGLIMAGCCIIAK